MREGKIGAAMARFRRALELNPTYPYALTNMGNCFLFTQQYDSAIFYLEISDGMNPFNSDTYNSLGFAHLKSGDTTAAEKYLQGAVRLRPDNSKARGNLLQIYSGQGRKGEYEDLVLASAEVAGAELPVVQEAAGILLARGDFADASRLYRQAIDKGMDPAIVRALEVKHPQLKVLH